MTLNKKLIIVAIFVMSIGLTYNFIKIVKQKQINNLNTVNNEKLAQTDTKEIKKQQLVETENKNIKQKQENLEIMWKKGYDEFFQKKYKQAIETERQVLKEDPNFYKAYAVEGIALAYSGNFKNGLKQIDQALILRPDYGYARFNKALANELYGYNDEAIKWYKKALEVEKFEWSYYGIASVYGRKGDIENTIKYLKLAIEINSNIKNAAKNEKDFDNVKESIEFKKLIKE